MKVLVVGSGGREHAICNAVSKSPLLEKLYCTPGNAGITVVAECWPIPADAISEIVVACEKHTIDFVIVGPEGPLALGIADRLRDAGFPCFGPSMLAAEIESSKGFMKDLCARAGVPTAKYRRFKDADAARAYVREEGAPIVVKADGLAAGKGVTVARTIEEAIKAIDEAMLENVFGAAGAEVVIEECMEGEEVSFFALCDGETARFFATAQDHKAAYDGDKGPNTGGMGAYSPAPIINDTLQKQIMDDIIFPTVREMAEIGRPFSGVLFAGLMMTKTGPRLIEFNARFGDPETEVMLTRLQTDLLALLYACSKGMLDGVEMNWYDCASVGVVMAAKGYPGSYQKGTPIRGLDKVQGLPGSIVFHAGTEKDAKGEITANGGRVLCVTAIGVTINDAQKRAYEIVDQIDWPEGFCRRDIGWRALEKSKVA